MQNAKENIRPWDKVPILGIGAQFGDGTNDTSIDREFTADSENPCYQAWFCR